MLQNDPLRLPAFHFDADPDLAFHFDADPDPAFHFDADPDQVSQMMRIQIRDTVPVSKFTLLVIVPYWGLHYITCFTGPRYGICVQLQLWGWIFGLSSPWSPKKK
jgi:hypothetical protein